MNNLPHCAPPVGNGTGSHTAITKPPKPLRHGSECREKIETLWNVEVTKVTNGLLFDPVDFLLEKVPQIWGVSKLSYSPCNVSNPKLKSESLKIILRPSKSPGRDCTLVCYPPAMLRAQVRFRRGTWNMEHETNMINISRLRL